MKLPFPEVFGAKKERNDIGRGYHAFTPTDFPQSEDWIREADDHIDKNRCQMFQYSAPRIPVYRYLMFYISFARLSANIDNISSMRPSLISPKRPVTSIQGGAPESPSPASPSSRPWAIHSIRVSPIIPLEPTFVDPVTLLQSFVRTVAESPVSTYSAVHTLLQGATRAERGTKKSELSYNHFIIIDKLTEQTETETVLRACNCEFGGTELQLLKCAFWGALLTVLAPEITGWQWIIFCHKQPMAKTSFGSNVDEIKIYFLASLYSGMGS